MASPRVAPVKPTNEEDFVPTKWKHTPGKKPAGSVRDPNETSRFQPDELKNDIRLLWRDRKINRYQLGAKLAELQVKLPHGKFLFALTKELHIPTHTAYRAMKFFRRVKLRMTEQILQSAKFRAKFEFDDMPQFERALESKQADAKLKALAAIADVEREKVKQAQKSRAQGKTPSYKVALFLSDGQKERFQKAWKSLDDTERTAVVYKAILDAAKN